MIRLALLFSAVSLCGCAGTTGVERAPSSWDWAEAEMGQDKAAWNHPLPLVEGGSGGSRAPIGAAQPQTPADPTTAAVAASARLQRPLWVHFTGGKECAPCVVQDRDVFTDDGVKALKGAFVYLKVTLDHPWAKALGVKKVPTDVFFPPGNTKGGTVVPTGKLLTPAGYKAHLQKYLQKYGGKTYEA